MNERVTRNPRILVGKPVISGTRIPVSLILNLLAHGYDVGGVVTAYPDLTPEDPKAALLYAAEHLPGAVSQPIAETA